MTESINGLCKQEVIRQGDLRRSLEAVEFDAFEWMDWFNHRRLLEPIGAILPAKAERLDAAARENLLRLQALKPSSLRLR